MLGSLPKWIPDADLCLLALMPLHTPLPLERGPPATLLLTDSIWQGSRHVSNDVRPHRDRDFHPAGIPRFSRPVLHSRSDGEGRVARSRWQSLASSQRGSEPFSTMTREELDPANGHVSEPGSGPVLRRAFMSGQS